MRVEEVIKKQHKMMGDGVFGNLLDIYFVHFSIVCYIHNKVNFKIRKSETLVSC